MMKFTLRTVLLCSFSLISVCVCEFHSVEVQPGEDVTLMCSNFTSFTSHIVWFRLADTPNISCISSMMSADSNASYCDEFQNGKFNMTSNTTTVFLMIQQVDLSDSGLYFCGCYKDRKPVIDSATYLKVEDVEAFVGIRNLVSLILGAVIIFLITVIIGLVVKIRKLQTAHKKGPTPQDSENLDSDALNYAALSFRPKVSRRPASENQLEPNVVYAATR